MRIGVGEPKPTDPGSPDIGLPMPGVGMVVIGGAAPGGPLARRKHAQGPRTAAQPMTGVRA
jgi:hypothetical protein